MAYRLKFSARASREIGEAQEWYELQNPGLGAEFIATMELQLNRLEQAPCCMPKLYPVSAEHYYPDFPTVCFMQCGII